MIEWFLWAALPGGKKLMTHSKFIILAMIAAIAPASAGSLERAFEKLDPDERARQACVVKGIEQIRKDKRLKADRLKTGIFHPADLVGTMLTATGGAVRDNHTWYALKFKCEVTEDHMKAKSFTYELGTAIPEDKWEDLGLWR